MNKKSLLIIVLLLLFLGMGGVEIIMNRQGESVSDATQSVWAFIFLVLSILWTIEDSKLTRFDKPVDFDFLMYIFWPIAFPYYLISTRGVEGITLFLGFLAIWCGPWLAGLVAYVYIYTA